MEEKLHPGGGIIISDKLVYEPIGNLIYVYNKDGIKGVSPALPKKDENGNKILYWFIEFGTNIYFFKGKPLKTLPFKVPSEDSVKDYIMENYPIKEGKQIFEQLFNYWKVILDIPKNHYYYNPIIATLQSWIIPHLKTVFYIGWDAKFGSGKTIANEAMAIVSKHGFAVGDITQAGTARLVETYQLSLFVDEIDTKSKAQDNELYKIFRVGYRRNNPYVRLSPNTFDPEIYDVFGVKGYTFHSDIERALKQRSLMTPLRKTSDKRLPIVNMYKEELGQKIFEDLFFWYMDNIISTADLLPLLPLFHDFGGVGGGGEALNSSIYNNDEQFLQSDFGNKSNNSNKNKLIHSSSNISNNGNKPEQNIGGLNLKNKIGKNGNNGNEIEEDIMYNDDLVTDVTDVTKQDVTVVTDVTFLDESKISQMRDEIFQYLTKKLSKEDIEFLFKFTGRNIELSFNVILISKAFDIDILKYAKESFEQKEESELSYDDDSVLNILKSVIVEIFQSNQESILDKGDFKGFIFYPKTNVYDKFRQRLKEQDFFVVGASKFKGLLTEIGFQENINMKRQRFDDKNLLCLIFDNSILKELGLDQQKRTFEEQKTLEVEEVVVKEIVVKDDNKLIFKDVLVFILNYLDLKDTIAIQDLYKKVSEKFKNVSESYLDQTVEQLLKEGEIFKPKEGFLKKI